MDELSNLAHVVGSTAEPIPLSYALVAAGVALYASFDVLRLRWLAPRLPEDGSGRPLSPTVQALAGQPPLRAAAALIGIGVTSWTITTLATGPPGSDNPALGAVFGIFWVGLVPASLLLGPVWRHLNPVRTVHWLICRSIRRPLGRASLAMPERIGYWPAALGLLAFAWLELVAPGRQDPEQVAAWLIGYLAVQLAAALVFGSRWFDRGDAFEVYSDLVGRLAPLGRQADGLLVLRHPLAGLAGTPVRPGLLATLSVLVGATAYDSLSSTTWWRSATADIPVPTLLSSLALVATATVVAVLFGAAVMLTTALAGARPATPATQLAHSLVPIASGYVIAHYFTLLLVETQALFGRADAGGDAGRAGAGEPALPPALVISLIQVSVVIAGHLLGAIAAHDRAVRLLPPGRTAWVLVPLLGCMLVVTFSGLTLLWAV